MRQPLPRATLVGVVVASLSLFAALNAYFAPLGFPDEVDYWTLAKNLVQLGTLSFDGVTPSAYRPPLVAWALTPFVALGWSLEMARPAFVVLYAISGSLAGLILCRVFLFSRWIPALGVAFVLGHPVYFFSAGNLYPQQILTPLLLAALFLVSGRVTILRAVLIGLITAISLFASAPAIFALLPIYGLLVWKDIAALRERVMSKACNTVIAGLVALICLVPYFIRNAREIHPGVYLSLNSGINLLFGNSPLTTPTSGIAVDLSGYLQGHEKDSEFDLNRHLTAAAVTNIRTDRGYYTHLYLRKFLAGFGAKVETVTHGYDWRATMAMRFYMTAVWLGFGCLLLSLWRQAALILTAMERRHLQSLAVLVLAAYLLTLAGYAIFFTRLRFRIPVDVALALVAASGWGAFFLNGRRPQHSEFRRASGRG